MTWPASAADPRDTDPRDTDATGADATGTGLAIRRGADGSFSLWSAAFGEGFHSGRGALREARETFLTPSRLERFPPGARVRVLEVCVGTGSNLALLLEACAARGLALEWRGLELDPRPLEMALASEAFRQPWQPPTLALLERLLECGHGQGEGADCRLLWGDARQTVVELPRDWQGQVDLVWHDAFSPRRCPQLWTLEFLGATARPLAPAGRWISYSSAAAARETLRRLGLRLVALESVAESPPPSPPPVGGRARRMVWSGGTVASPTALEPAPFWRELSPMERDHLASAAGEPYRDPTGAARAASILASRLAAQAAALAGGERLSSSAWRRRWGVDQG